MRNFRRLLLVAGVLAVAGFTTAYVSDRVGYEPEPWLRDLDALERHMGLVYANLEWVVERRGLELPVLDRRTRRAIEGAGSRRAARTALGDFVEAFDDPHLRIERPPPAWLAGLPGIGGDGGGGESGEEPALPPEASGREVCRHLGYQDDDHGFGFDVEALPGWSALPDDGAFPSGTFWLHDGRRAGILRIAQFGEDRYLSACAEAWEAEAGDRRGSCGGECLGEFRRRASDRLARRVSDRVRELRAAGIDAIVVDVTGNGGGSEWVDPVTRIFSDRPLRAMRVAGVRHPRSLEPAAERLAVVDSLLTEPDFGRESRALLELARGRLASVLAEIEAPCDRSPIWRGRDPECRQTITAPTYATGVFDHLPEDALADVPARADLYAPFGRDVPVGTWSGPLYVLADGGSASATEAFVAMLKDNGAATVIGERTYGAGCGYTDGGLPIELPNSRLVVWMPDCARYRIDGTNEIEGIEPDVALPWSELDGAERARALVEVVSGR